MNSRRTMDSEGSQPASASISPTQPQQSPPQSPARGSPGAFNVRPQIEHFIQLVWGFATIWELELA
ncbi:hypothetical protein H6F86_31170 [Phormidium sp. FACHB-592]|uniref:Uncharacterized protein n=1 Tax=Stenomitos frigidus AS-A4 TaxID=2933935 RepID=A0ABV0KTQ5_9CYAN|nr:hypothetical protein [Phormidium sp. FACHB-592]MBD2078273.1 hypothetical protein [Phormidium sp. FACHB-592]